MLALQEFFDAQDLLFMWTLRGIKARYQQTVLGAAWAVEQPLGMTIIYAVMFSVFLEVNTGNIPYPVFVYTGLLPWILFAGSITLGVPSIVQNMDLVTKIYFPREIVTLSAIGIPFVEFLAGGVVLLLLMLVYGMPIPAQIVFLPLLVLVQIMFAVGLILLGSAMNVLVRDVGHLIPLILLVWQFATPIVYPLSAVPQQIQPLYLFNPMATVIVCYKLILLEGLEPLWGYLLIAVIISLILIITGYRFFKRTERSFADVI